MTAVTIRPARNEDAPALLTYLVALSSERLDTLFERQTIPTLAQEEAWIDSLVCAPDSQLLLACDDDEVVGLIEVRAKTHPQLAHTAALGVSVLDAYRGRGVGTALFARMFEVLDATPTIRRVELDVFDNNPRAVALYERLGFAHEGRKRAAVRVNDEMVDILMMAWTRPTEWTG